MPIYHVTIGSKSRPRKWILKDNILERDLLHDIVEPYNRGEDFRCDDEIISQGDISSIKITESEKAFMGPLYRPSPQRHSADRWQAINQMKDVTDKFIKTPSQRKKEKTRETVPSRNVFIVHGRNHKPLKELKALVSDFGLNPIVLHEKPSGSRTVVEKLEKYSGNIGYTFVILTPDDVGVSRHLSRSDLAIMGEKGLIEEAFSSKEVNIEAPFSWKNGFMTLFPSFTKMRARQNVVLEFGYFIGLLGRDRVCCLYKGDIALPSDMQGIVYLPFEESVNEARDKIVKELKAAGYEIKI